MRRPLASGIAAPHLQTAARGPIEPADEYYAHRDESQDRPQGVALLRRQSRARAWVVSAHATRAPRDYGLLRAAVVGNQSPWHPYCHVQTPATACSPAAGLLPSHPHGRILWNALRGQQKQRPDNRTASRALIARRPVTAAHSRQRDEWSGVAGAAHLPLSATPAVAMAASTSERDLNPTVEDYHSDDSEDPVLESFRRSPAANVAAKRSHPSDLGSDKAQPDKEKVLHSDLQSDSGYSSHTAGTMSSADSVPSAKMSQTSTAPSSAASMPPPSPAATRRRPTVVEDRRKTTESPRKPLQRNNSTASRQRPAVTRRPTLAQAEECRDPNCKTCGPNAPPPRRGRRESLAMDSGLDVSYSPSDVRSQRSDPAPSTYASPPSPTYNRQPAPYMQGSTMVQPAQTRPRASSTARRPMSYHGDPGQNYFVPGMPAPYPSPPHEYGPPPAMPTHYSMPQPQHHPQMAPFMMNATPPSHYYQGGHPMAQAQHMPQTSPPYEHQRPQLSARTASNFPARRPVSGFGGALVTYDNNKAEQSMPSARYGNAPQSARQERFPMKALMPTAHHDSESSEEYDSEYEEEAPVAPPPKQLMPPPKMKSRSKQEQRPVLRHAKTTQVTQVYNDRRERRQSVSQSQTLPERPRERDNRTSRVSTAPPSRSISVSRPAPPKRVTQSAYDTPRARVLVENPRSSRRQSYQAYERAYEPQYEDDYDSEQEERRLRRRSKVYRADEDDAIVVTERPARRRTDASVKRAEYVVGKETARVMDDVEAYQQRTRGNYEPLSEQVHKIAKQRASRVPSDPDRKTRISQSARTTVTNGNNNGEIRLRVDASAPLSLSFNGDMEGRTLQINPAEDGMADIVIGGQRGEDDVYRSERGSVRGSRKSMIAGSARREAEEVSVKSGRSSQGRRDREVEIESRRDRDRDAERRPLRRQTRYY
ncbi:uncharacterized protein CC84DRAFT_1178595 [Paraphaeosphaeria sporulosa]|uniref:Uncharacterized protein n=1 Tax=Paraphaeosphaeria sporulosa TaxID=1460663 RepID=A0A177C8M7_9PLEO|nr:uncharacterized protein CC84DRAFT_1178595 [Paraphaeosphaeria sporulosa]OAG03060.1 hypothetical protein CC84DRAFT_1178595 [Paraphaeosphaeria sporulosa]